MKRKDMLVHVTKKSSYVFMLKEYGGMVPGGESSGGKGQQQASVSAW